MTDLSEFLAARLDEDEATAKAAASGGGDDRPNWVARFGMVVDADDPDYAIYGAAVSSLPELDRHIARHDPARVLREVAAKRAAIAEINRAYAASDAIDNIEITDYTADTILRALASAYSDHPDYDPAWAPGHD